MLFIMKLGANTRRKYFIIYYLKDSKLDISNHPNKETYNSL